MWGCRPTAAPGERAAGRGALTAVGAAGSQDVGPHLCMIVDKTMAQLQQAQSRQVRHCTCLQAAGLKGGVERGRDLRPPLPWLTFAHARGSRVHSSLATHPPRRLKPCAVYTMLSACHPRPRVCKPPSLLRLATAVAVSRRRLRCHRLLQRVAAGTQLGNKSIHLLHGGACSSVALAGPAILLRHLRLRAVCLLCVPESCVLCL